MFTLLWAPDPATREHLLSAFPPERLELLECSSAELVEEQLHQAQALVVDFEVARPWLAGWRANSSIPIVVLVEEPSEAEMVFLLQLGSCDFLQKPVFPLELLARLQVLVGRRGLQGLKVDWGRAEVVLGSSHLYLTAREFQVLQALHLNRDRFLSRQWLIEKVWGHNSGEDFRLVDATIKRLRRKVGHAVVETVRGLGFRLSAPIESVTLGPAEEAPSF